MTPRTLSHFELRDELGRGGMGVVYRAFDTKLKREVALKVLPPELVADSRRRARFVQEARAAAALEHPHIGSVYEIDEGDGQTFIAMALIDGDKLSTLVARGPVAVDKAIGLATEIAEGLAHAHERGIVHRDLKPQNVMLTKDGHAQIIDFGLAKLIEEDGAGSDVDTESEAETKEGAVVGTAAYMSPEQARGLEVDHRSDVFSFGTVLHEMATGQRPFGGPTRLDTLTAITTSAAPPLGGEAAALQAIVDKCLAKDPADRYQGMRDVVVDLRTAKRRIDSGVSGKIPPTPATRSIRIVAAVGALAALIAAIVFWPSTPQTPTTPDAPAPTSVAVLPFENQSPDPEAMAYLSNGLGERLATKLTSVGDIRVVPWLTTRRYAEHDGAFQEVAVQLHADYLLAGSYSRIEDRIQGSISLIDGGSGMQAWSMDFDEPWAEIFALQRRIAANAVQELKGELTVDEKQALAQPISSDADAYDLYLKGTDILVSRGDDGLDEALALFNEAHELDPGLAETYVARGVVHLDRHATGLANDGVVETARDLFSKAIELDASLHSAYAGLATTYWLLGSNEDALKLRRTSPNSGTLQDELLRAESYLWGGLVEEAVPLSNG